jgi:hypothetical protein
MSQSKRIVWGLLALVLAGALFTAGEFFLDRPDLPIDPTADPELFARTAAEGGFAVWAMRGLVGVFLEAVGMIALYLYLQEGPGEHLAFWGLLTSLLGDFAGAILFGSVYFIYPEIAAYGLDRSVEVVTALEVSPALMGLLAIPSLVGLALFAGAIWRSEVLPQWSGVLMLAGFVLILAALDVFVLQVLGNAVVGLGALWIFVHAWRNRPHRSR